MSLINLTASECVSFTSEWASSVHSWTASYCKMKSALIYCSCLCHICVHGWMKQRWMVKRIVSEWQKATVNRLMRACFVSRKSQSRFPLEELPHLSLESFPLFYVNFPLLYVLVTVCTRVWLKPSHTPDACNAFVSLRNRMSKWSCSCQTITAQTCSTETSSPLCLQSFWTLLFCCCFSHYGFDFYWYWFLSVPYLLSAVPPFFTYPHTSWAEAKKGLCPVSHCCLAFYEVFCYLVLLTCAVRQLSNINLPNGINKE